MTSSVQQNNDNCSTMAFPSSTEEGHQKIINKNKNLKIKNLKMSSKTNGKNISCYKLCIKKSSKYSRNLSLFTFSTNLIFPRLLYLIILFYVLLLHTPTIVASSIRHKDTRSITKGSQDKSISFLTRGKNHRHLINTSYSEDKGLPEENGGSPKDKGEFLEVPDVKITSVRTRRSRIFHKHNELFGLISTQQGLYLEIRPDGSVRGTHERTTYTSLKISSIDSGVVAIQGVQSKRFLAINKRGKILAVKALNDDCHLLERMPDGRSFSFHREIVSGKKKKVKKFYLVLDRHGKTKKALKLKQPSLATYFAKNRFSEDDTPPPPPPKLKKKNRRRKKKKVNRRRNE